MGRGQNCPAGAVAAIQPRGNVFELRDNHPAVSAHANKTRWMRLPGEGKIHSHRVNVERLSNLAARSDELTFADASHYWVYPGSAHKLNQFDQVALPKRAGDRYLATITMESAKQTGPSYFFSQACGSTPLKAMREVAALAVAAGELGRAPTLAEWRAQTELANSERIGKLPGQKRRKHLRESKDRELLPPMPKQVGWVKIKGAVDQISHYDDGHSTHTEYESEPERAEVVENPSAVERWSQHDGVWVSPLYDDLTDRESVWVVARPDSETDYETYSESGYMQIEGCYATKAAAEAGRELISAANKIYGPAQVIELPLQTAQPAR